MKNKKLAKIFCAISMVCDAILLVYEIKKFIKLIKADEESDEEEE